MAEEENCSKLNSKYNNQILQILDEEADNPQEKLIDYQKKFRNLESDRKAYAEETVANIKKQRLQNQSSLIILCFRTIIDKLKNESSQLKDLIAKLNSQQQKTGIGFFNKTQNVDQLIDELKDEMEVQKQMQKDIQLNIDDFQKKIKEKRQTLGGINAGLENQSALNKQIKILENRLDKANQKFNDAIAVNKSLRQQIDSLRRERVIFDNLYKKLEKELHEKRKEMANIIETANTAYEERDKANDQIQNLKQQAKRESADFEKDLRDLSQIMEKNKKTMDYIKLTEKHKEEANQQTNALDTDKFTKKNLLVKDKNISQQNLDKINKFEEDLAKIQAATQITDFDELIKIFIKNEETYVNAQSKDLEELENQVTELREERAKYEGQGSAVDIQRKKMIKQLEEKLNRSEKKNEQFEFKCHDVQKLIHSLTNWIETLFNTIGCDKQLAKELAGQHGVTDSNMIIYLGIIEERVNQILAFYSQIMHQRSNENLSSLLDKFKDTTSQKAKVDIPTFADEIEEDDIEGNKPLTLEEFRQKALEKLDTKKQQVSSKNKIKQQKKQKK